MSKFKIILDILMTILMIFLMKVEFLGLQNHEIIGITIFFLFLMHKILNFKFVKIIGKNIFNKKMKLKSKLMFMLDVLLLIFMFSNVLTGILISKFVFTGITVNNIDFVTMLHKFFGWWTLIIIAIHVGLHLDRLVMFINRKVKLLKDKGNIVKYIVLAIYIIFVILGIRSLCKYSIYSKMFLVNDNREVIVENDSKNSDSNNLDENEDIVDVDEEEDNSLKDNIPTLDEYLSQFHCGGCRKNCSLLNPKCDVGKSKREEKIKEYYKIYGSKENNNDSNDKKIKNNEVIISNKENKSAEKCKNKSNLLDVIDIIFLFMGGAYYIGELLKNKSNK